MSTTSTVALTRNQQLAEWGASVEAEDDHVTLHVGEEEVSFDPAQAQAFAYYLARAYYRANLVKEARS